MIAVYQEFKAHAELLKKWDELLSERWSQLWKWYIVAMVAAGVSGGLGVIPGLAGVSSAVATLIPLVVPVLRIVYLHKTASCFETLGKEEAKPIE